MTKEIGAIRTASRGSVHTWFGPLCCFWEQLEDHMVFVMECAQSTISQVTGIVFEHNLDPCLGLWVLVRVTLLHVDVRVWDGPLLGPWAYK